MCVSLHGAEVYLIAVHSEIQLKINFVNYHFVIQKMLGLKI